MSSKAWGDSSNKSNKPEATGPWKKSIANPRPAKVHTRSPGRWLALQALLTHRERDLFVSQALDDLFQQHDYDARDRRFATELASEVVRRQLTLDTILNAFAARGRENVEEELWEILRLGCYQLAFAVDIPIHAALNETVEMCERVHKPNAKRFINGILRAISREVTVLDQHATSLAKCSPQRIPVLRRTDHQLQHCMIEFARPLFSIPGMNPTGYLSQATSLPEFFVDRLKQQIPDQNELLATTLWLTTQGTVSLRVNLLRASREQVIDAVTTAGARVEPGTLPESIVVNSSFSPVGVPGFAEGWFSVQDESAMAAIALLDPQPKEAILDLCAAPGGKTTHIAERMQNTGSVVACDTSELRMNRVLENMRRLQLNNIRHHVIEADGSNIPSEPFDAALVDVPCSNTGVLGKRPEARWRLTEETYTELVPLQKRLLADALKRVKVGGRVVYSTCSIDRGENEEVVQAVLQDHPDWCLQREQRHRPGHPADGAYQALLVHGACAGSSVDVQAE